MRHAFLLSFFILAFGLTSCSSDNSDPSSQDSIVIDGTAFLTANNSGAQKYNVINAESTYNLSLQITETGPAARTISVALMHPEGSASDTYILKNDQIASGIAVIALLDETGQQIAGGSESEPTGTFSLVDKGNHRYQLTFNDVVLDPGTDAETHLSGSCTRTFVAG